MLIHLHSQATTTPKVRAAIQTSDEPGTVLAARFRLGKGARLILDAILRLQG